MLRCCCTQTSYVLEYIFPFDKHGLALPTLLVPESELFILKWEFWLESYKVSMGQFWQGLSSKIRVACMPCNFVWMLDIVYEKSDNLMPCAMFFLQRGFTVAFLQVLAWNYVILINSGIELVKARFLDLWEFVYFQFALISKSVAFPKSHLEFWVLTNPLVIPSWSPPSSMRLLKTPHCWVNNSTCSL